MKNTLYSSLVPFWVLLLAFFSIANAQEKTKKELKEEQKLEKQKQIALLIDSKEFVFIADRMIPQGGRTVNLTTYYAVDFHPELISSHLPFAGRGFSGIGYGGDDGMTFDGKPTIFSIEKTKKMYQIKAEVKGKNDTYSMMLRVNFDGNAYMSINSNNRSSVSYDGEIEAFKSKKK